MPVKVVDASALAALLFGEPRAEEVSHLLGESPLVAPGLLRYEVGSICLKKLHRYPQQRAVLLKSLSFLSQMAIQEVDVPIEEALALAERTKLTVYDASYLWLARALRADLVTLDSRLGKAAGSAP